MSAGNYVPFVFWFNFFAGFFYIIAGIALYQLKVYTPYLVSMIAFTTIIVFIFFGLHIHNNGAYEMRTVIAMTIRSTLWVFISGLVLSAKALFLDK